MNLSKAETGLWIEGSHRSPFDFMCMVIEFAHDYGFDMDWDRFVSDINTLKTVDMNEVDMDTLLGCSYRDISEAIDWTYEDALDYLNDNTRPGLVWVVREQGLILMDEGEADD